MDPTLKVANKYPNVFFEHATGFKRAKNMATYAARFYEGRYIQGQIAAKMSKTGIIGYIVSCLLYTSGRLSAPLSATEATREKLGLLMGGASAAGQAGGQEVKHAVGA